MTTSEPSSRGFTLTELLVTIAIVAILAAIATPSFVHLITANRIQSASTEFQSALAIARAEAIKRGGDTRVAVVANLTTAGTPDWASGVTVFFDTTTNANGDAPTTDGSKLIMRTAALPQNIQATANFNSLIFNGLGRSVNNSGGMGGGTAAFGASSADWRCTVISPAGRTRIVKISNAAYNTTGCPIN